MMDRPKDIPQDIWDAAELEVRRWPLNTDCVAELARAILAERERCAKVVKFIRENAAKMSVSERDDVWLNLMDRVAEGIELGVQF